MSSSIRIAAIVLLGLIACDDDGNPTLPDASPIDAFELPWWTPEPGEAHDWEIQLAAPLDVEAAHAMYVLDLWDVATETTIDYDDGPVTVPAGALAGAVADLHARTPRPIVVCHVDTGAIRLTDPDAMKFPGFEAAPPDDPTPPAEGSVIGWSTPDGKRYLDLRQASTPLWSPLIEKRIQLAKDLGCDAIDGHYNDSVGTFSGFTVTGDDAVARYQEVAAQAHARELSAGMRATTPAGLVLTPGLVDSFDWMLAERCAEAEACDQTQPFTQAQKAVFALEYDDAIGLDLACQRLVHGEDGLQKHDPPDGAFRMQCP